MNADQQAVHDRIVANNARVGFGPAIGYAYSAEIWRLHNESSAHLLDCSLTAAQVRIVSLMTVRHWNAAYPWSAQARTALGAGLDPAVIEAINSGDQPNFDDQTDRAVHDAARELLATGTLSDAGFEAAEDALGYRAPGRGRRHHRPFLHHRPDGQRGRRRPRRRCAVPSEVVGPLPR